MTLIIFAIGIVIGWLTLAAGIVILDDQRRRRRAFKPLCERLKCEGEVPRWHNAVNPKGRQVEQREIAPGCVQEVPRER